MMTGEANFKFLIAILIVCGLALWALHATEKATPAQPNYALFITITMSSGQFIQMPTFYYYDTLEECQEAGKVYLKETYYDKAVMVGGNIEPKVDCREQNN